MARLKLFLVAESVSVDQGTNEASVFEVLESVPFKAGAQNAVPRCVAFSLWRMEDGDDGQDFQVLLRVHRPGADDPNEVAANFTAQSLRHRVFTYMRGLPLEELGALRFEVLLNGNHAAEHLVTVFREEEEGASA